MYINILSLILLCYRADLLDMVLPTTVDLGTNINNELVTDVEVSEDLLNPDSLECATNAAISAINKMASKNKALKPSDSLGSRSISKSSLEGILPASDVTSKKHTGTDISESAMSDGDASNILDTSDLIRFKQAPSTSSDKIGSPCNMILACTGNNSEEKRFDRYVILQFFVIKFLDCFLQLQMLLQLYSRGHKMS